MAVTDYTLITRAAALAAGKKRYFTGKPCRHGHIAEIQVSNRTCCECNRLKKTAEYRADLDGSRAKRREYYAAHANQINANSKRYREKNRETLLVSKKNRYEIVKKNPEWQRRQAAYRAGTKAAKREYDKLYRARNPERGLERATKWRKANPEKRRAVLAGYDARRRTIEGRGDSTAAIHAWVKSAPKVCYWCGIKCPKKFHIDHYEPLSKGGQHVVSNLVIACPKCNLTKNAKDPYEFAASVGRLF